MRVVDGTLYRVLGGRDADHEDLVQASFEQIVRSLIDGKFARECSLSTWAAAITCNVALHAIRRRRTERKIFDETLGVEHLHHKVSAEPDPESQVTVRRELERVRFHLSQMSEKLARSLLLSDVLGCTQDEVAALTDVTVAAAQARLFRGRQELADRLARDQKRRRGRSR
jgi:RNA polymerase sigma-70 factor (ECF subfamily)